MWATRNSDLAPSLTMLGGLLILASAAFYLPMAVGAYASTLAFGLIIGLVILALGVALRTSGRQRPAIGTAVIVLSFLSFLDGANGFFVGALLGLLGGLLAITSSGRPFWSTGPSRSSSFSLGIPCGRCGRPVPSWTSTCPYCGYAGH
jgi:hypothetical protein